MAYTSYSDIYDPVMIMKLIGQDWANEAKIIGSGIVKKDMRPLKGTQTHELRQTRFQGRSGQALKAGDTISSAKKTQTRVKHPIIWRYDSTDEPDVIEEIEDKNVPMENADLASDIRKAAAQYLDDSAISCMQGTAAALTGNQSDKNTTVVSLSTLISAKAALDDKGFNLDGGAMFMRSEVYWKLADLGLVAATSNTFGVWSQDMIVKQGKLPVNIVGLTPIMSNKLTALGSSKYYVYFVGPESLVVRGNDIPIVKTAEATNQKKFSTITNFKIQYGIGFNGMDFGATAAEDISDTALATSGNWTLAAANEKDVPLARLHIKTA